MRFLLLLCAALLSGPAAHARAEAWPEIRWEALVPKGWDPSAEFRGINFAELDDADPRAIAALERLRKVWDAAPVDPAFKGRRGRIAGFALPLERVGDKVTEFLIVPYFGACIHTPPPPANQIIHARSARPLADIRVMSPIWTYGTFTLNRSNTEWGVAGYGLTVERTRPYVEPARGRGRN